MLAISALSKPLNEHFQWNKARITCFSMMVISLLQKRTVNLTRLATGMIGEASINSRQRRMQRFFAEVTINYDIVAQLCVTMFFGTSAQFYLTLDRTNWKWGKSNINILMLAAVYKGQAIPVLWLVLDKRGNSNTRERIALMKRFIAIFGHERIRGLLADREFIGTKWFAWLRSENIPIVIRIKHNANVLNSRGVTVNINQLFYDLRVGYVRHINNREITGTIVNLTGLRLDSGELLILAHTGLEIEQSSIEIYALRWEIETLFGCLKGRGFNFEDTRIIKRRRIKKVVALLAIAYCWAHKTGEWRNENIKKIPIKKHGRLAQSLFRYGLDWLDDLASHSTTKHVRKLVQLIEMTFMKLDIPPSVVV